MILLVGFVATLLIITVASSLFLVENLKDSFLNKKSYQMASIGLEDALLRITSDELDVLSAYTINLDYGSVDVSISDGDNYLISALGRDGDKTTSITIEYDNEEEKVVSWER